MPPIRRSPASRPGSRSIYATDREKLVTDLHPGARATSQLFPEAAVGFDPALDTEYAYDPDKAKQLLAEAGFPDGFEFNITVLGQPTEDQVAIQSQWAQVGVTLNFVIATSTDQVFAAVQTDPLLFGPFAVGANPAGFVAGVVYGGFMNTQGAKEPEIEAALGAALGATGDAQEQALTDLNRAITSQRLVHPGLRGLHLRRLQRRQGDRAGVRRREQLPGAQQHQARRGLTPRAGGRWPRTGCHGHRSRAPLAAHPPPRRKDSDARLRRPAARLGRRHRCSPRC